MTPVIVALYDDPVIAERVRTQLMADGFSTDRVEVTSRVETAQADPEPGKYFADRVATYFHTLFDELDEQEQAEDFASRVVGGSAAVTVHPQADHEMSSARRVLHQHCPVKLEELLS